MGDKPPWVDEGEVANPLDAKFHCVCVERRLADFISVNEETFPEISDELTDLLQRMLIANPDDRISIDEILHHPWLA